MSSPTRDPWIIDDESGFKIHRSEAQMTWDGYLMGPEGWYEKHPQLDICPRHDDLAVKDARPRQPIQWAPGQGPNDQKHTFND